MVWHKILWKGDGEDRDGWKLRKTIALLFTTLLFTQSLWTRLGSSGRTDPHTCQGHLNYSVGINSVKPVYNHQLYTGYTLFNAGKW